MAEIPDWAAEAAANPDLAPLWDEYHRRASANGDPHGPSTLTLAGLTNAQATAVADLIGLTTRPSIDIRVPLAKVAAAYRTDRDGLAGLLVSLRGPIGNRAANNVARREARQRRADEFEAHARKVGLPSAAEWARSQSSDDTITVLNVVAAANPEHPTPIPVVAATQFGNAHALDPGQRAGRLLTGLLAALDARDPADLPARERRRLLRACGLADDDVSSTVAVWRPNLPDSHPAATWALTATAAGESVAFTLGALRRWPPTFAPGRILVVENPAILASAAANGHPDTIVCTSGVPSSAVYELIGQYAAANCRIDVHADYDATGLRIAADVCAVTPGAHPYLMDVDTYRTGAALSAVKAWLTVVRTAA